MSDARPRFASNPPRAPRALVLAAALLLSAAALAPAKSEIRATDLRLGAHADKTRFVIDLTENAEFRIITLADPYRVVIDLPEIGWQLPARPLPAATGLVTGLRYGLFKAGVSRVVLDLAQPARIKAAFMLPPSGDKDHRLVVDLAVTGRDAFLADMLARRGQAPPMPAAQSGPLRLMPPAGKPASPAAKRTIAIDPGHGGVDPGATGRSGVREKDLTLHYAREIADRLEATGRYHAVLTRDRDIFLRLRDRIAVARAKGAELFISIHADTIRKKNIRGMSIYTLSERASDAEAAALADKENKADLIAGVDLSDESPEVTNILIDLAQRETMNQSARFAGNLVDELRKVTTLLRNTHRFAGFAVLKAPDVPSVLIELGFLSNASEERALRSAGHRGEIADAIAKAVGGYFDRLQEANRL